MKNRLNKNIIIVSILLLILISCFTIFKKLEYIEYTKNYNNKINYIVDYIKTNTNLSDEEVIDMINNDAIDYNYTY